MDEVLVAGADGCPRGWVVVVAVAGEGLSLREIAVVPDFATLLVLTQDCRAVGVDIPIGLSDGSPRLADHLARRLLGRPGASSVFPPPLRPVLACHDYREACAVSEAASGRRLSKQAFNLLPKVREADAALAPALQARVHEVHPELAFRALNRDAPLPASKHTVEGLAAREALLGAAYGVVTGTLLPPQGARKDDVLDAGAVAWSAARIARGEAVHLPANPVYDARGLKMEIVF